MRAIDILINPSTIAIIALLLSVIWMLRDEKDRARIELVFALVLNLFYGVLLNLFMGREGAIFPWKFDHVLLRLDASLGIQAACIARPLQGFLHIPLWLVYQAMVPMMIAWFLLTRYRRSPGSIILAYVAELVSGPLLYMIVPACGPIYAFGKQWLQPPAVAPEAVRLAGMPNAFPSLHIGTALVFLMFAPGKIWKAVALLFLAATCLATLSTGEHYVIDLIPGLAFGAVCLRHRNAQLPPRRLLSCPHARLVAWGSIRFYDSARASHAYALAGGINCDGSGFCARQTMERRACA